jgi:ubiquinone/menaquinone biosynthesis C-methylase UbiE
VAGRRVLDVGCGEGALAVELHRRGALVTAVDPSGSMLAAAQTRARAEVRAGDYPIALVRAAGERLPFAGSSFDVVLAKTVLCFVPDAPPMVTEMARVLRPGGRFVIGELNKWSSWAAQRRLRAWLGSAIWRRGRFRTAGELRSLARQAGLDVETVRGAVYYPRLAPAARLMARYDACFAHYTTLGAAFIAMAAVKPDASHPVRR